MEGNLDRWRKIILKEMKSILKPAGYRKSGMTFRKLNDDVWQVAQLQSSSRNTHSNLVVYANVGLCYFGKESKSISNPKSGPKAYECHWNARVASSRKEQCWEIRSDREALAAAAEIADGTKNLLDAALNRYPTPERVFDTYRTHGFAVDRDLSPWACAYPGLILKQQGFDAGLMAFEARES